MERFEIQPVLLSALPDVADFLHKWRGNNPEGLSVQQQTEDAAGIERRLRWLLAENPVAAEGSSFGFCIRDNEGMIRGMNLFFPSAFLAEDQRLIGLCSGSFFVEPQARSLGFHLFRKYLVLPGYPFFFATTCNANAGRLWKELGGREVPNSDMEYVVPLRLDVVIPAFVASRTSNKAAMGVARFGSVCADPVFRLLTRQSARLTVEPSQDWEKLSALSRRHRPAKSITSDHSVEFLRWRYGPSSPLYPSGVYLFRDSQGNEGWFSLGNLIRGEQGQVRGSVLLDAVWPWEKMSFRNVFREILRLAATEADAIFLRPRPGVDYREYSRLVNPRKLPVPRAFVLMRKGTPFLPLESLECDDTDDIAWKFQWTGVSARTAISSI